jgi:hypothetical protein
MIPGKIMASGTSHTMFANGSVEGIPYPFPSTAHSSVVAIGTHGVPVHAATGPMSPLAGLAPIVKDIKPSAVTTILRLLWDMPTTIELYNVLHQWFYANRAHGWVGLQFTIGTDVTYGDHACFEYLFGACMMTATPLIKLERVAIATAFRIHIWPRRNLVTTTKEVQS